MRVIGFGIRSLYSASYMNVILPVIPTTTIATTIIITAIIAPNRDGTGSVMDVVGVLDGLGTGEAACRG